MPIKMPSLRVQINGCKFFRSECPYAAFFSALTLAISHVEQRIAATGIRVLSVGSTLRVTLPGHGTGRAKHSSWPSGSHGDRSLGCAWREMASRVYDSPVFLESD